MYERPVPCIKWLQAQPGGQFFLVPRGLVYSFHIDKIPWGHYNKESRFAQCGPFFSKGWSTMAEKQYFVTEEGLAALEKELEYLKTVRRKEVAEKIKVALSFGDLSENSEYDEAKNDQAMMEARIADLEVMLQGAVVIDESELTNETVHIGSKIEVDLTSATGAQSRRDFKIVGSNEADPRNGKISDESAVGKALIGAKVGDTVNVETPAGISKYHIVTISR